MNKKGTPKYVSSFLFLPIVLNIAFRKRTHTHSVTYNFELQFSLLYQISDRSIIRQMSYATIAVFYWAEVE